MPKKPSPDDGLSPLNFRSLNQTFYAAEPADYFNRRLHNLILVAGNREGLDRLLAEGVRYRGLTLGEQPPTTESLANRAPKRPPADHLSEQASADQSEDSDDQAAEGEREAARSAAHFVSAEAEVLAHHAGETLLRLYLAHEFPADAPAPACPALNLSRLRSFAEFKRQLRRRFGEDSDPVDPANLNAVARLFYGTDAREKFLPMPPTEAWDKSLSNIDGYLRAFANQHLERAPLYNAAKHGFALTPTEMSFQMDDGAFLKVEGDAIQFLEVRDDRGGRPKWQQVTHWVRPDRQMALVFRACQLIEMLWQTARHRYLPARRSAGHQLRLFAGATYLELLFSDKPKSGIVIEDMRMELLYEEREVDHEEHADA